MRELLNRLRPYGRVTPYARTTRHLRAWLLGVRDGWQQPHDLGWSTNVDHLFGPTDQWGEDPHESLDAGINLGQWLRAPLNHQQPEGES